MAKWKSVDESIINVSIGKVKVSKVKEVKVGKVKRYYNEAIKLKLRSEWW